MIIAMYSWNAERLAHGACFFPRPLRRNETIILSESGNIAYFDMILGFL